MAGFLGVGKGQERVPEEPERGADEEVARVATVGLVELGLTVGSKVVA